MNKVNRDRIPGLLKKYQAILRLEDWDITLSDEKPDEKNQAEIDPWPGKNNAWLRIAEETHDNLDHIVTHELLHLYECRRNDFLETVLREHITDAAALNIITQELRQYQEISVDKLAGVIESLMRRKSL